MKYLLIIVISILLLVQTTYGQQKATHYTTVGDVFPDYEFSDLVNYKSKTANAKDFRGKWLIVDFWSTNCGSCLHSFPKMDSLAKEFTDKVQIIMVGTTKWVPREDVKKTEKLTKEVYHRLEKMHHLSITTSFDSVAKFAFGIYGLPLIYVIAPDGMVKAKVLSINRESLNAIMQGRNSYMERGYSESETREDNDYKQDIPLLTQGQRANGGVDTNYIFRSILVDYNNSMSSYNAVNLDRQFKLHPTLHRFSVFRHNFNELLNIAFWGKDFFEIWDEDYGHRWPKPIWEASSVGDNNNLIYAYSLEYPKEFASKKYLMNSMQSDFRKFLGLNIRVEKRQLPVYYLVIKDSVKVNRLTAKDPKAEMFAKLTFDGISVINCPIRTLTRQLILSMQLKYPVIDSTGFTHNVSVNFKADMVDPEDVFKKLSDYGFKLVEGKNEMDAIIVGP